MNSTDELESGSGDLIDGRQFVGGISYRFSNGLSQTLNGGLGKRQHCLLLFECRSGFGDLVCGLKNNFLVQAAKDSAQGSIKSSDKLDHISNDDGQLSRCYVVRQETTALSVRYRKDHRGQVHVKLEHF